MSRGECRLCTGAQRTVTEVFFGLATSGSVLCLRVGSLVLNEIVCLLHLVSTMKVRSDDSSKVLCSPGLFFGCVIEKCMGSSEHSNT